LLINDGNDYHDNGIANPDTWWALYDTDFGSAIGDRIPWNGLIRRDFTGSVVLVNEPGGSAVTADLGQTMMNYDGTSTNSVTLEPGTAAILFKRGYSPNGACAEDDCQCMGTCASSATSVGASLVMVAMATATLL
jgi:hypothetical protein